MNEDKNQEEQLGKEDKKKLITAVTDVMNKVFEEEQKKPFQYVVAYYQTSDDKLIGYHNSSFCQLTDNKENAKRYNGEDPYPQLTIIRKNLDSMLDKEDVEKQGLEGLFHNLFLKVRKQYFNNYKKEDIYINAEYLDENIPSQKLVFLASNI